MLGAQFGHKSIPHALVSFLNKLPAERLSGRWVLRSRGMLPCPGNHVSHQGNEFYRSLGEAVNGLLFVRGIFPSGQQSDTHQAVEPVRQNVGSNALFGKPQQIIVVPAIAEHDIPDYNEAPAVAQQFHCEVNRTIGASFLSQAVLTTLSLSTNESLPALC